MNSIKIVFLITLAINVIAVAIMCMGYHSKNDNTKSAGDQLKQLLANKVIDSQVDPPQEESTLPLISPQNTEEIKDSYSFIDPSKAYQLLTRLDIFGVVEDGFVPDAKYDGPAGGFGYNNNYCNEHRAFFVARPEIVFEQQNFVTNYWQTHKLRTQVIPQIGRDLHPEVHPKATEILKELKYDFRIDGNMFFMFNLFFKKRQVGTQFSCLSQVSNHIPGHDKMARKDSVGQALADYSKLYESRTECFNSEKYFPKTWVMKQKNQCLDFFNEFNSLKYKALKAQRKIVFFRKIGANVHEGKGVFPVDDKEERYIRKKYKNGELCGTVGDNNVLQYNIHNVLLLDSRKFHLRQYLVIVSTNPVIAYYHDGYARLSLNEYDPRSNETKTFITNIGVNLPPASQENSQDKAEEIEQYTSWLLEEMAKYLMEKGLVKDPKWLDNYFRKECKKAMIHLVRMAQDGFAKISSVFEIYGIDFLMDENLNIWFIEANATPLINGFTPDSTKLINEMLFDTFEIVFGLLRSRMKRVVNYINKLTVEIATDGSDIPDLYSRRQEFKEITKNYFEPEFMPRPENSLQKIIDENEVGVSVYQGLIEEKCI